MNRLLSCLSIFTFSFFLASTAHANAWADKILSGKDAENMLAMLSNAGWIADGEDNGKHVYILFSPTCGYCEMLFDQTRGFTDTVQFRWIPVAMDGELDSMYEMPDTETLQEAFHNKRVPEDVNPERTAKIRQYTVGGISFSIVTGVLVDDPKRFGFPTLIFGDKENVSIVVGMPQRVEEMLSLVPYGKADPQFVPAVYRYAETPVEILPSTSLTYNNSHSEDMPIHLMPFDDAPRLGSFIAGSSATLPVSGITANGYVAIPLGENDTFIYLQDREFVKSILDKKE